MLKIGISEEIAACHFSEPPTDFISLDHTGFFSLGHIPFPHLT